LTERARAVTLAAKALGEMSNRPPPLYRDQRPVRKAGHLRNTGKRFHEKKNKKG
jgi:hypothetical protein